MSPTKLENCTHNNGEPVVGRPVQLEVWSLQLLLHDFTVAAASAIKICPVLVSHLSAGFTPTVLSALDETRVPVSTNYSVI